MAALGAEGEPRVFNAFQVVALQVELDSSVGALRRNQGRVLEPACGDGARPGGTARR